jgi:hypothetical protein
MALCRIFWSVLLLSSVTIAQSSDGPKTLPYNLRDFARAAGNVGGWWSLLSENEKAAFLDGYQTAMKQSYSQNRILCKVLKDGVKVSSDEHAFNNYAAAVVVICDSANDFAGFETVTTKDLTDFYSDRVNQPVAVEWTLGYIRDKASGRKTEGQLLDTLKAKQKEIHDCSKYPYLCKLGTAMP